MEAKKERSSRVNFLLEAASLLPPKNRSLHLLQSYYLTKSRRLDSKLFGKHSDPVLSNEEMCSKCSTPWCASEFAVSIGGVRQTKKQSQKIQNGIDDKSQPKQYYLKRQIKSCNNNVIVKCNLCGNTSKTVLWKRTEKKSKKKELPSLPQSTPVVQMDVDGTNPTETSNQKKKKKAKKDKTAGLLYTIVKPAQENQQKPSALPKVSLKPLNEGNSKNRPQSSQATEQKSATNSPISLDEKDKRKKAKKDKKAGLSFTLGKPALQNPHQQKSIQPKVIPNLLVVKNAKNQAQSSQASKMNKNSLLKLANALKSKGGKSSSNSTQDRLQKMFQ